MMEYFRKPLLTGVLWTTAIFYFGIQWKGASTIAGNKIFSSSRETDRADFATMVNTMSEAARRVCGARGRTALLFGEGDVVVPYLKTVHDTFGGCEISREIPITFFSKSELEDCNIVFIREFSPGWPHGLAVDPHQRGVPDLRFAGISWTEMERWTSSDGRFGFAFYGHRCSGEGSRKM
jgi:hypothetical protein